MVVLYDNLLLFIDLTNHLNRTIGPSSLVKKELTLLWHLRVQENILPFLSQFISFRRRSDFVNRLLLIHQCYLLF